VNVARDEVVIAAATVAAVTDGRLVAGEPARRFEGVTIDSRRVSSGQLFIGIRGERFEGSDYAGASIEAGATGVVVRRGSTAAKELTTHPRNPVVIEVEDTTAALQSLGRHVRRSAGSRVTAITGSAGKTTTKEVAAEFLAARYSVYRNPGNLNNHIGLPLSLIELRSKPEMAVVELGMNHPGEIRQLVSLAEPDMRVWTNVGDAHIGFFPSADAIADAKAEILEGATDDSVLVANADDARVMSRARRFTGRLVTFGREGNADVRATDVTDRGIEGTSAHVTTPVGEGDLDVPLVGDGNLSNVLAATAVAITWGVSLTEVIDRAARLRPARRRGEVIALSRKVTLVDDSYNSSPAALKSALRALSRDKRHTRRVALLGEMLELGSHSSGLHEECGRVAAESGLAALVTVGGAAAKNMADAARNRGLRAEAVRYVETSAEAAALVRDLLRPGDLVLVKGSRGVRMDVVADRVREEWA
jgi:UDP-N-acetylmuramoyl-tripeptide--D-alanyl-D-alanine ligase